MTNNDFFPDKPKINPIIYAYTDPTYPNMLKVGYTTQKIEDRMKQHYPTLRPGETAPYKVVLTETAMYNDGGTFLDKAVHRVLEKKGFYRACDKDNKKTEWFRCSIQDVKSAINAVKSRSENIENRDKNFRMRPEQQQAVEKTYNYFINEKKERPDKSAKFLWNAKMRFGKTFAAYQLAKKMNFKRILILTFKPAVQSAWREDLLTHVDFENWQFISETKDPDIPNINIQYKNVDKSKPIVCFGSFQDFLGLNENGGIKQKNEWIHTENWDLVIFDEYHFGAWKENAKSLFENEDEEKLSDYDIENNFNNKIDENWLPITTNHYLFLSGTPFRALNSGEFIEDQIFSWTYSDEQRAKRNWDDSKEVNPYLALPRMVMLTYKIPNEIEKIAKQGEFDEFDLNEFFKTDGKNENAQFKYKNEVQHWLDLIRGAYTPTTVDNLKQGAEKPAFPFSDVRLLNVLNHTVWYFHDVSSCYAMRNLLIEKQNSFYQKYTIIVCAGIKAGIGANALPPVLEKMTDPDPLNSKTITLTCGKLMTGVTVKPWTGIFMLCNMKSPETYFQSVFRVQSPWEINDDNFKKLIIKKECYVFDFSLDRALKQISDYSRGLDIRETDGSVTTNPEKKVDEFVKFLPVLAYDGFRMKPIQASEILDIAMAGTSATLLAKRWESALLVNVDNETLEKLINNAQAMEALSNIEAFRSLNSDIETIINKSEHVKKAKTKEEHLTQKEKTEIKEEEKEMKSKRKEIQDKLIKFATRIPIFMYLSDYRETTLKEVIEQLEGDLFKKVTGLNVKDFDLLVSLNVFNSSLMNDAVYKFKRYEDSSLSYTGIDRHAQEKIGLWDTVLSRSDYELLAKQQKASLSV